MKIELRAPSNSYNVAFGVVANTGNLSTQQAEGRAAVGVRPAWPSSLYE